MKHFDVCVIGGGPSGYAAAMRAVDFHRTVLLVEARQIGGAGIFNGALSSKTFWEIAKDVASAGKMFHRFNMEPPRIPFQEIAHEVGLAVNERAAQLTDHIRKVQGSHTDLFELMIGRARLTGPHEVEVSDGVETVGITADHIILATGSRPRVLPDIPVDEEIILTSDGIGALRDYPESLVILGAGVIGCEFATIFSYLGRTKVFLIDKEARILPFEDADVSEVIGDNLEAKGVHIHRESRLASMAVKDGRVEYVLDFEDGRRETFNVEKALISVGRVPNCEGLGLEEAGVALTPSGHVVNEDTVTTVPHIHAVGDLTADIALVNVGELEGRQAVEKIFGKPRREIFYENISAIMFLDPEIAGVGMNEMQAQQQGFSYRVASYRFDVIPRAIAMRRPQGFFKILVTDDDHMKVLGMRAVGEHASSAIQAVALLIAMDKGIEELAELIHPHPSIIEGIQECVRMLRGKSIFKPTAFRESLICRRYHGGRYVEEVFQET